MTSFADLLRKHRNDAGLTQAELADRAGISVAGIGVLERGTRQMPHKETVRRLEDALELARGELGNAVQRQRGRAPLSQPQRHTMATLTVPATSLIGREQAQEAIAQLLQHGRKDGAGTRIRLLTLTGPGGVGKTRLAIAVADSLRSLYEDGVFEVDLAPLRDPSLMLSTIAQTLGLPVDDQKSVKDRLWEHLHQKHVLLVLDNFEQVAASALGLVELLTACDRVQALVTSRAALDVSLEQRFHVPTLTLPQDSQYSETAALRQVPAVALFVERAQAVEADFELTTENAPQVAQICRRLDGLPLALELAAARVNVLPPAALLTRLERRLSVLTGGRRDRPLRQQTLRATFDWSYELLDATEQALFRRLGVFVGGCTLEAVEAVCNPEGALDVLGGVASLVEKSLLRRQEDVADEPRFGMLETIDEYALGRLRDSEEAVALQRAHAAYYLALAEEAEPALLGPEQRPWLARLDREHHNLRAALQWSSDTGETETGLRVAGALSPFWRRRGYLAEGGGWLDRLLAKQRTNCHATVPVHAKALKEAGILATRQGDFGSAGARCDESFDLYTQLGDEKGCADVLNVQGIMALEQGDIPTAIHRLETSLAIHRSLGNQAGIAASLTNLGDAARLQGDYKSANTLLHEALSLYTVTANTEGRASTLAVLGIVMAQQGDYEPAAALFGEALSEWRAMGNTQNVAHVLNNLGNTQRHLRDYKKAERNCEKCLELFRSLGDDYGIALALTNLGGVALGRGDYETAEKRYRESLDLNRTVRNKLDVAECLEGLTRVACAQQRWERATRFGAVAEAIRTEAGAPPPPDDAEKLREAVATLRDRLGDIAFVEAWEAAQRTPRDDVIGEACQSVA